MYEEIPSEDSHTIAARLAQYSSPADGFDEEAFERWLRFGEPARRRVDHQFEAEAAIEANGLDISEVSPEEVVALYRLTDEEIASTEPGVAWARDSLGLHTRLQCTLKNLTVVDPERAKTILAEFARSPLAEDRRELAENFIVPFTEYYDPYDGVRLWDRLMGDPNKEVRDTAERQLIQVLTDCRRDRRRRPASGMHAVEQVDDTRLDAHGLSRDFAYRLLESYAYAENGQYRHDLGRAALGRLVVPVQPGS